MLTTTAYRMRTGCAWSSKHSEVGPGPLLLTGRVLPLPADGERVAALSTRASTQRMEWRRAPMPWHVGTGGNFAVTRTAFLAAGGNDERLGTGAPGRGGNDLDLFYRLLRTGVTARYEPDLLVQPRTGHRSGVHPASEQLRLRSRCHAGSLAEARRSQGTVGTGGLAELRVKVGYERRADSGWINEARVLAGTGQGLLLGLRISATALRACVSRCACALRRRLRACRTCAPPRVSVLVPAYNMATTIGEATGFSADPGSVTPRGNRQ